MELNANHTTEVKIQITQIKCLGLDDEVITLNAYGKLNTTECKQLAKDNGVIYITKELTINTHEVKTSELLKLV